MLITNVVTWKECLSDNQAWDTLTWFAALIGMASYLNKLGFIKWFSDNVVGFVSGFGLSWQAAFGVITLLYFYSHYLFASGPPTSGPCTRRSCPSRPPAARPACSRRSPWASFPT